MYLEVKCLLVLSVQRQRLVLFISIVIIEVYFDLIYLLQEWIMLLGILFFGVTLSEITILMLLLCQISVVLACLFYIYACVFSVILTYFVLVLLFELNCVFCFVYIFVAFQFVIYNSFAPYFSFLSCSHSSFVLIFFHSSLFVMWFSFVLLVVKKLPQRFSAHFIIFWIFNYI